MPWLSRSSTGPTRNVHSNYDHPQSSYLVLCVGLGCRLPGAKTIPEQIAENKGPYYKALEVADKGFKVTGAPDLSAMEQLIEGLLAKQLVQVMERAKGGKK